MSNQKSKIFLFTNAIHENFANFLTNKAFLLGPKMDSSGKPLTFFDSLEETILVDITKKLNVSEDEVFDKIYKLYVFAHSNDFEFGSKSHYEVDLNRTYEELNNEREFPPTVIVMYSTNDKNHEEILSIFAKYNTHIHASSSSQELTNEVSSDSAHLTESEFDNSALTSDLEAFFSKFDIEEKKKLITDYLANPNDDNRKKCLDSYV